jgi:RNA polymerase sigma factor (sigma-70 family)
VVGRDASGSTVEAFASVYDEQVWRVYGFFGFRVASRADAEDLTQQVFERALRAWSRFDPSRASATTWVMAIAKNLLIDHYRRESARATEPLEGSDAEMAAAEPLLDQRLGPDPELARGLARLGDRERELIALRFGGDLTGAEIAELTGLSLANVQQILSRTLRGLRAELERELGGQRARAH